MLLKFLQTAHGAEIVRLALMMVLSRSPTWNNLHSAHRILRRGFGLPMRLQNREAGSAFVFHRLWLRVRVFLQGGPSRICKKRRASVEGALPIGIVPQAHLLSLVGLRLA